jgi:hypothetical protein
MERTSWTDDVKIDKVLHIVKEGKNALQTIKTRMAHWIGHILRRNCLLKDVVEEKIEGRKKVMGRRGRGRKKLLNDLKEKRENCKVKEEALDRTLWRTRFGRDCGPLVRQTRGLNKYLVVRDISVK